MPSTPPTELASLRVLIVDDNRDAAETLCALLVAIGHSARFAFDGMSGLLEAENFKPEVIFLDIEMPGMNGFDVSRALRMMPSMAGTRIVALTGYKDVSDDVRAKDSGFDEYLLKPAGFASICDSLLH